MTMEQMLKCMQIAIMILSTIVAGLFYRVCKLEVKLERFHALVGELVDTLKSIVNEGKLERSELELEVLKDEEK